ncbi:uncharacterized protein LOC117580871 [Drosophila guanche]|uniref:Uncharacterized protein n=1 Tax=Drosophila guanche TaxID=7266 RepID=A0A3B0J7A6_DROGU|nr:uncharacterized protein LOC117580871 [Drosophila guanche]SPP78114.1 Hypothetical predicted protein [Drosophila guanche]
MSWKSTETFSQKSRTFWLTLVRLLLQLLRCVYQGQARASATTEDANGGLELRVAAHRQLLERQAEEYAKVDLLHRLLVQQQLHELEQRRLMRLALARRRLQFSN